MKLKDTVKTLGYEIVKDIKLEEIHARYYELKHIKTSAKVVHIANDDPENVFCLSFRTYPESSDGVAHILEHTVLCGSKNFPVKDPFFSMNRRSLNTFMNAFTGSDFTCYPASSQIEKDFYNLLDVYLDAAFYPELKKLSFLQEGHRLEYTDPDNSSSDLIYKGIVFNEMKGSLTSADSRLWQGILENLLPDTIYANNSGGDPKDIPNLTYEQFVDFHKKYYHPSQCLFYFYGNLPLEKHLAFLNKRVLDNTLKAEPLAPLLMQPRFKAPKKIVDHYPCMDKKDAHPIHTITFLTESLLNQEELLGLSVLEHMLMGSDGAPLKRALLESHLVRQTDAFIDLDMNEVPIAFVSKGCTENDPSTLENVFFAALKRIAKQGFTKEQIDSAIHRLEFSKLEITGNYGPYGLTLFMRAGIPAQHGVPIEDSLSIYSHFKKLHEKDKNYFSSLIQKYFLDNPHCLIYTMLPDEELGKKEFLDEKIKLQEIQVNLSEKEKLQIISSSKKLKQFQQKQDKESLDCLPKLEKSDIPKKVNEYPLVKSSCKNLTIYHANNFTNHILYLEVLFDLPKLTEEELLLTPLFTSLITELGTKKRSFDQNLNLIQEYTGGVAASVSLYPQHDNPDMCKPTISIKGKALDRNIEKFISLVSDFLTQPRFDEKNRIKELILQMHVGLEQSVQQNPMGYAIKKSMAHNSVTSAINEKWNGLTHFQYISNLKKDLFDEPNKEENLNNFIKKLIDFKNKVLHLSAPTVIVSCDRDTFQILEKNTFFSLSSLKEKNYTPWQFSFLTTANTSEIREIASPIAFNALSCQIKDIDPKTSAAITLATNIFDNTTLHPKIREQGGAYGSGSNFSRMSQTFYFYSYRDPHISATVSAFSEAVTQVINGNFTEQDLQEAIFGLIQNLDSPIAPGSRGMVAYSYLRTGKSLQKRQEYRDAALSITTKDIQNAIKNYLPDALKSKTFVSFCGKELFSKEKNALENQNLTLIVKNIHAK